MALKKSLENSGISGLNHVPNPRLYVYVMGRGGYWQKRLLLREESSSCYSIGARGCQSYRSFCFAEFHEAVI
jgi:hypothetical protein